VPAALDPRFRGGDEKENTVTICLVRTTSENGLVLIFGSGAATDLIEPQGDISTEALLTNFPVEPGQTRATARLHKQEI